MFTVETFYRFGLNGFRLIMFFILLIQIVIFFVELLYEKITKVKAIVYTLLTLLTGVFVYLSFQVKTSVLVYDGNTLPNIEVVRSGAGIHETLLSDVFLLDGSYKDEKVDSLLDYLNTKITEQERNEIVALGKGDKYYIIYLKHQIDNVSSQQENGQIINANYKTHYILQELLR